MMRFLWCFTLALSGASADDVTMLQTELQTEEGVVHMRRCHSGPGYREEPYEALKQIPLDKFHSHTYESFVKAIAKALVQNEASEKMFLGHALEAIDKLQIVANNLKKNRTTKAKDMLVKEHEAFFRAFDVTLEEISREFVNTNKINIERAQGEALAEMEMIAGQAANRSKEVSIAIGDQEQDLVKLVFPVEPYKELAQAYNGAFISARMMMHRYDKKVKEAREEAKAARKLRKGDPEATEETEDPEAVTEDKKEEEQPPAPKAAAEENKEGEVPSEEEKRKAEEKREAEKKSEEYQKSLQEKKDKEIEEQREKMRKHVEDMEKHLQETLKKVEEAEKKEKEEQKQLEEQGPIPKGFDKEAEKKLDEIMKGVESPLDVIKQALRGINGVIEASEKSLEHRPLTDCPQDSKPDGTVRWIDDLVTDHRSRMFQRQSKVTKALKNVIATMGVTDRDIGGASGPGLSLLAGACVLLGLWRA